MRPRPGRLDRLRRDLDPIAAGELKLETIEAEEHLKLVILSHITSYQDLMLRDKKWEAVGGTLPGHAAI